MKIGPRSGRIEAARSVEAAVALEQSRPKSCLIGNICLSESMGIDLPWERDSPRPWVRTPRHVSALGQEESKAYRIAGIDVHKKGAGGGRGRRGNQRRVPVPAPLVRGQPGGFARVGCLDDRKASRESGDGIEGAILATGPGLSGTGLAASLSGRRGLRNVASGIAFSTLPKKRQNQGRASAQGNCFPAARSPFSQFLDRR